MYIIYIYATHRKKIAVSVKNTIHNTYTNNPLSMKGLIWSNVMFSFSRHLLEIREMKLEKIEEKGWKKKPREKMVQE